MNSKDRLLPSVAATPAGSQSPARTTVCTKLASGRVKRYGVCRNAVGVRGRERGVGGATTPVP